MTLTKSEARHLRLLLGWIRCEVGDVTRHVIPCSDGSIGERA